MTPRGLASVAVVAFCVLVGSITQPTRSPDPPRAVPVRPPNKLTAAASVPPRPVPRRPRAASSSPARARAREERVVRRFISAYLSVVAHPTRTAIARLSVLAAPELVDGIVQGTQDGAQGGDRSTTAPTRLGAVTQLVPGRWAAQLLSAHAPATVVLGLSAGPAGAVVRSMATVAI